MQDQLLVIEQPDGKYKRIFKYSDYDSHLPETIEEKKSLFNVFNGESEDVIPMKDAIGKELSPKGIWCRSYSSIDELTGEESEGVVTYIKNVDGLYYATSSKAIYHTLMKALPIFKLEEMKFKISSKKRENGTQILLKLI